MKSKTAAAVADIIIFLCNCVLGWFLIILFSLTGTCGKFPDPAVHRLLLIAGSAHIVLSILGSVFFCVKERTRYRIRIGKKLLIYNILMTLFPYCYLAAVTLVIG